MTQFSLSIWKHWKWRFWKSLPWTEFSTRSTSSDLKCSLRLHETHIHRPFWKGNVFCETRHRCVLLSQCSAVCQVAFAVIFKLIPHALLRSQCSASIFMWLIILKKQTKHRKNVIVCLWDTETLHCLRKEKTISWNLWLSLNSLCLMSNI